MDAGIGHLLLPRGSLNALNLNGLHDLIFTDQENPNQAPTNKVTLKNLCIVDAVCVTPGMRGDPKAAYLVRVADRRLLYRPIPIDKAYNVYNNPYDGVYFSATLNGSSPWTWQQMFTDIWQTVPQLGTAPLLPFTPDGLPQGFEFYGRYAMQALRQILERLCCTLKLDPTTDTFSVVQIGAADAAEARALAARDPLRVWDEDPLQSNRAKIPAAVKVAFMKWHLNPDTTGASPFYYVTQTDPNGPSSGTEPNTYAIVYDDELAVFDYFGGLANGAALASRAQERAKDYFRVARMKELRRVYGRPLPDAGLIPGSQIRAIRWGDRGRGMVTEILYPYEAEYPEAEPLVRDTYCTPDGLNVVKGLYRVRRGV